MLLLREMFLARAQIKYERLFASLFVVFSVLFFLTNIANFYENEKEPKYYIQYECTSGNKQCGGWADRLKGIFASYALSQVLNRSFLIKITHPCHINTILRPNKVNWDQSPSVLKAYLRIFYKYDLMKEFESINLKDYLKTKEKFKMISIQTGIMFSDAFAKNPLLAPRLKELGYANASDFVIYKNMYKWYNEMFRLSSEMDVKYRSLLSQVKPNEKTFLICIQVRIGSTTANNNKDLKFTDEVNSKMYWKFVMEMFLSNKSKYNIENDNYRIFLTTDKDYIKKEASLVFDESKLVYNKNPSVHIDRDYYNLGNDCSSIETTIIDFHLQQHCDASVVSHSGFGLLGAWNRPDPLKNLYVFTKENQHDLVKEYYVRDNLVFKKINDMEKDLYFL